jgi:hypothetical protein
MPMVTCARLVGVLNVRTSRQEPFAPSQIRMLSTLAAAGAVSLENARLAATRACQLPRNGTGPASACERHLVTAKRLAAVSEFARAVTASTA